MAFTKDDRSIETDAFLQSNIKSLSMFILIERIPIQHLMMPENRNRTRSLFFFFFLKNIQESHKKHVKSSNLVDDGTYVKVSKEDTLTLSSYCTYSTRDHQS